MRAIALAAALAVAPAVQAQKDVGDPLEHFLATKAIGGVKRKLDEGVSRVAGDFNNDGLVDFALWQETDFSRHTGMLHLYFGRKDGRYAASGSIVVNAQTLFKPVPGAKGSARLFVCERRGAAETSLRGYAVNGFIVAAVPRDQLPASCNGENQANPICREACAGDTPLGVERLDVARFRANGFQAWIGR